MLDWFVKKGRERRAKEYLILHPQDEPAVRGILVTLTLTPHATARDAAETVSGRPLSDDEWKRFGIRWEQAWSAIVSL